MSVLKKNHECIFTINSHVDDNFRISSFYKMKSLTLIATLLVSLVCFSNNVNCMKNSYDKLCFIRYLVKNNLLDGNFKIFNVKEALEPQCETAVNLTLEALRTSSQEPCVVEFLNRKDIPDVLLKKFLMPQLTNGENRVVFDNRFTEFRKRAVNASVILCNNQNTFNPDIVALMKYARNNKDSKQKELKCLEIYSKNPSSLTTECIDIVQQMKNEFNERIDSDVRKAFTPPNEQLIDFDCGKNRIENDQMFKRFSFFVVLATSRDMSDKQIEAVAKSTVGSVNNAQRTIFECLKI